MNKKIKPTNDVPTPRIPREGISGTALKVIASLRNATLDAAKKLQYEKYPFWLKAQMKDQVERMNDLYEGIFYSDTEIAAFIKTGVLK